MFQILGIKYQCPVVSVQASHVIPCIAQSAVIPAKAGIQEIIRHKTGSEKLEDLHLRISAKNSAKKQDLVQRFCLSG
jgi:hypothetical protein